MAVERSPHPGSSVLVAGVVRGGPRKLTHREAGKP